jgi:hypothetical protein
MKAPLPSPMKSADDRQQVLFRGTLTEGWKGKPQISAPQYGGGSCTTTKQSEYLT